MNVSAMVSYKMTVIKTLVFLVSLCRKSVSDLYGIVFRVGSMFSAGGISRLSCGSIDPAHNISLARLSYR